MKLYTLVELSFFVDLLIIGVDIPFHSKCSLGLRLISFNFNLGLRPIFVSFYFSFKSFNNLGLGPLVF